MRKYGMEKRRNNALSLARMQLKMPDIKSLDPPTMFRVHFEGKTNIPVKKKQTEKF